MDNLSLLFRLKGDSSGAIKATDETRAAVNKLRQSFGPELTQSVTVANRAFASLGGELNSFVAQRVPLIGGAFIRVTEGLRNLQTESPKVERAIASVAKSIETLSTQSGKSIPQIATFLKGFIQIQGQADRNKASVDFFGASLAQKLTPELEKTGQALATVSAESATTGASIAAMAGPIGIAVAALAIEIAAVVALTNALFDLAKQTAEIEGRLFDLSQQTGVSVETLSALDVILSKVGGNLDSAVQSLITFQRNLDEAQDSSSKAGKTFARLGIDTHDTETALRDALKALAAMPEGFKQTELAAQLFGARGGKQFLALLKESGGDIDQVIAKMDDLTKVTTEQAKLADEFNDTYRDLQLLLRGVSRLLGREVLPIALSLLQDTEKLLKDNRVAFDALGIVVRVVAALIAAPLKGAIIGLNTVLTAHKPELLLIVELYERLAEALQLITNNVPPDIDPNAIPKQSLPPLDFKVDLKREDIAGAGIFRKKEDLDKLKAALANELEALQDSIDDRDKAAQAETEDLRRELDKRQVDFQKYINTARQQSAARLAATLTDLKKEREAVAAALAQRAIDENEAAKRFRQIDNQERDARRAAAKETMRLDDEVEAHKRKQLQATTEVLRATIDAQLRIAAIGDEQRIASIRELAAARVKSEEQAEREILKIRLDAIDREKDRLDTEVLATKSITDPEEQLKVRARLNLELRVLTARRTAIEQDGERNVEAGRQRDLQNERDYADDLKQIRERIRDVSQEIARDAIRLLAQNFATRKEAINALRDLELQEEQDRHRRETESIDAQKREVDEQIKVLETYIAAFKANTKAEIEERQKTIESLEKLRQKRLELQRQQEKEDELNKTRQRRVNKKADEEKKETNPLDKFKIDIEKIAKDIERSVVPLGTILRDTFFQVADAIGSVIENWVLLGETGPAVMRKILAVALATIAKEAAVNAIKQLALGFATLFLSPGESAGHFAAAALWGSIAGGAAVAGRSVAGDLFKSKSAEDRGGASSGGPQSLDTIMPRNQAQPQTIRHVVTVKVDDSKFGQAVSAHFGEEWRNGGPIRELVLTDGKA